jgi:magnesium-protoporphyrin O-methyltransferase
MVDDLRARGLNRTTVLELGGGVGALHLELLREGAAAAVNVELSPEWETAATGLLREHGVDARVERRVVDAVEEADTIDAADIVVMHRVVCCYPDADALMGVAAERARRLLLVSFPRERALVRVWIRLFNVWMRMRGVEFRTFVHPERSIEEAAERHGLGPASEHRGRIWRAVAFARP